MNVRLLTIALATASAFAQTPAPSPAANTAKLEFEVASVKAMPAFTGQGKMGMGFKLNNAQLRASSSLMDFAMRSFGIKDVHLISAPTWMRTALFEVSAKLPEGATREQAPEMLQAMLQDRFKMKFHRETKEIPVYALVVAKGGLKIKELPADPDDPKFSAKALEDFDANASMQGVAVDFGRGSSFSISFTGQKIEAKKMTIAKLANSCSAFMDRPVMDMTELKGNYDFALQFTPEDFRGMLIQMAISNGAALPPEAVKMAEGSENVFSNAIQTLGLKLEPRKAPVEVVVIDSMEKTPTEN